MTTESITDAILRDISERDRGCLPGQRPTNDQLVTLLKDHIRMDGLDEEDRLLALSALPVDSNGLYLSQLDKGLSTAKVFAARFRSQSDRYSKSFIFKIGPRAAILDEADRIERLACRFIHGIDKPLVRTGITKALVAQSFAGLTSMAPPTSFREYARSNDDAHVGLSRFLKDRLSNWYGNGGRAMQEVSLDSVFSRYLRKGERTPFDHAWQKLQAWVYDQTGIAWEDVRPIVAKVRSRSIRSPLTIVHGDLHTQNLLVDGSNECWPIDFAWATESTSPAVDFTMLECSLKFLAIPQRSDLRTLFTIEHALTRDPAPKIVLDAIPYRSEHLRVLNAIFAVRKFAFDEMQLSFEDYRQCLFLMTYALASHPKLNRPYVLGSLQLLEKFVS